MSWLSTLFRPRTSGNQHLSPDVAAIFDKIINHLKSEDRQNSALPQELRDEIDWTHAADEVPNPWGEFGKDLNNPVPVNGPIGELLYLSSLCTKSGIPIAFHRLGSANRVDVFEILSLDGSLWDVLYLNMYYPSKSRQIPQGYLLNGDQNARYSFRGSNYYCRTFPRGLFDEVMAASEKKLGLSIADPRLKALDKADYRRPAAHKAFVDKITVGGQSMINPKRTSRGF